MSELAPALDRAKDRRLAKRREARGGLSVRAALRGYGNETLQPQIKLDGKDKKTQLHRMGNTNPTPRKKKK